MRRFKVFRHRGHLVVGMYGDRRVIPVWTIEQAFIVIGQIQGGVAFCDFESLATEQLPHPLQPSWPRLRAVA